MSTAVFLAVLAAAAMHAGWNAVLKLRLDPLMAVGLVNLCAGLIAVPALVLVGTPRMESWPWLAGSVAAHLGYYWSLSEAYRRADMSQVYPIARGGAPLLTTLASLLILREPVSPLATLGIVALASGVAVVSLARRGTLDGRALGFAALTAVFISLYTLVDGTGARIAGNPHAYSAALFVFDAIPLTAWLVWRNGSALFDAVQTFALPGFGGGALSLGAYWIAIWAMTIAPIALVAALRETSVLFASAIAVVILKEPLVPARIAAACLIVAGLIVIKLG